VGQIADAIIEEGEGIRIQILSPMVKDRKGEFKDLLDDFRKNGFVRARIDGEIRDLDEDIKLAKTYRHNIDLIVDRLVIRSGIDFKRRLTDSLETVTSFSDGIVTIMYSKKDEDGKTVEYEKSYSEDFACTDCGISFQELTPRMFSFNAPQGACPACNGIGSKMEMNPDLVVPNKDLSLNEGAIVPWAKSDNKNNYYYQMLQAVAQHFKFSMDTPFKDLTEEQQHILLYGTNEKVSFNFKRRNRSYRVNRKFEGVIARLERLFVETKSNYNRKYISKFMSDRKCPVCDGKRLKPEVLAVSVGDKSIIDVCDLSIKDSYKFFNELELNDRQMYIGKEILKEIKARLGFLVNVGLDYISMSRSSGTLSGGEAQRIRLATQIGAGLVGVLYILDEPSIGLHQRDNRKLISTLKHLRDIGNTLIVVEHDEETMLSADYIVDIGPGAGEHGGKIIAQGSPEDIMNSDESITGRYLSRKDFIPVKEERRPGNGKFITVKGARENNLKNVDVDIPLGLFTCVTGVSGSGKSSLVNEVLYKGLSTKINKKYMHPGKHDSIEGIENIDKIIRIDQTPIGRTPRSNPATYVGVFTPIRELFASTPEAKARGYKPGRFSFNVKGGRCESCYGDGIVQIEMHFLSDVYVPCEVCHGKRYNEDTLDIRYKGKNIYDVLEMTVEEALEFFENIPKISRKLQTLYDVGLSYIKLGQPATTLSGGEAQRVKLAKELSKTSTGNTLYLLDEPTTGLHFDDIKKLLSVLDRLTDAGNTVLVIEHNLDVIKTADYIIDLGPEGGDGGGEIIATGTPEEIAESGTYTGLYLKEVLEDNITSHAKELVEDMAK
jgi:excinuclease ABC subunit A